MTQIEELLLSAYNLGKENEMFKALEKVKKQYPKKLLGEQYEEAYKNVMKTD